MIPSAETWSQIAAELGIDPDQLDETVQTYNAHIQSNLDPLGKDLSDLPAIGLPPLYALPLQYSSGRTLRALKPMPTCKCATAQECAQGLYAVGELQGLMCASKGGYNGSITSAIYAGYAAANHIGSLR